MKKPKCTSTFLGITPLVLLLVGCTQSQTHTTPPPKLTTPLSTSLPPTLPSPTSTFHPTTAATPANLLTMVQNVEVTWDDHFSNDNTVPRISTSNIFYVPATGNLIILVKTGEPSIHINLPPLTESDNPNLDNCPGGTIAYKEFTPDMRPTGKYGYLLCGIGDWNSMLIGNDLYVVKVTNKGPDTPNFWRLFKFNVVTWERLGMVDVPLETNAQLIQMRDDGPTMSFINGFITLSGDYWPEGSDLERGSHHHFVTTDLQLAGQKILASPDVPAHSPESSLRQLPTGDILIFTADKYFGGSLMVIQLNKDWKFIDEHTLRENAFFPLGAVLNSGYWFVAYYDVSKKPGDPVYSNVGLAAFDVDWNLIQDEKVTDFDAAPKGVDFSVGENPWVESYGNHLYVSYTVSLLGIEAEKKLSEQTFVSVYTVNPMH